MYVHAYVHTLVSTFICVTCTQFGSERNAHFFHTRFVSADFWLYIHYLRLLSIPDLLLPSSLLVSELVLASALPPPMNWPWMLSLQAAALSRG